MQKKKQSNIQKPKNIWRKNKRSGRREKGEGAYSETDTLG